jgi:hypothetical protein
MKAFCIGFLFLSLSVHSSDEDCYTLRLRGKITIGPNTNSILVNIGTLSERTFIFPIELLSRIAGHTRLYVVGDFVFKDKMPVNGSNVLAIQDLHDDIPHPLEDGKNGMAKKVSCPK